jgi:MerR family transcriptional regulator, heat shock protein HspR
MTEERGKVGPPASDRGVYGISVAAELSGISQQTLRLYERYGLVTPIRSVGGTRRYSADDLYRLQRISELTADGVNLAGVARILSLEDRNAALDDRNVALEDDNTALRDDMSRRKSPAQSSASRAANNNRGQAKRSPRRRKS